MHSFLCVQSFSIEGERVEIKNHDNDTCKIIIQNAGPEDNGVWKFEGLVQNGQQFISFKYNATVSVKSKNRISLLLCFSKSVLLIDEKLFSF